MRTGRSTIGCVLALAVVTASALLVGVTPAAAATPAPALHAPLAGPITFRSDFGEPRDGGARTHLGNDLYAPKLTHVLATVDGTVTGLVTGTGRAGNQLTLTGRDGWRHLYIHLNDDTPGTDDGANPARWLLAPGIRVGSRVLAGQHIAYQGDSGNAEEEDPQLHYELRTPGDQPVDPHPSLVRARGLAAGSRCERDANPPRTPDPAAGGGYRLVGPDGGVATFGDATFHGSLGGRPLAAPVVAATATPATPGGGGYRLVGADGGVFAFGDARFRGSLGGVPLVAPIVAAATSPSGDGYWLVAADGGVFAFGDARFHGSTGGLRLSRPVVAAAATPSGGGYWLVAADGGVFAFGDARFHGSTGAVPLAAPVTGVAPTPGGGGYALVAADGGLFSFGDARPVGSVPGTGSCGPFGSPGALYTSTGRGAWVASGDGRVVPLGDAPDHGDAAGGGAARPTIALIPG